MTTQRHQTSTAPAKAELAREMLAAMWRIRLFEEAARALFDRGLIRGAIHLSIGQEATIVGACAALDEADFMTGTHRSHGHPIAKGARLGPLMAELLGRSSGVCRGKGGSMHLADFSVGSLGESGIVAGSIPTSVGAALSSQIKDNGSVAMAFFGDGATTEGVFHESMNIAALWALPVVFLCENNLYGATVPIDQMTPGADIARRARGVRNARHQRRWPRRARRARGRIGGGCPRPRRRRADADRRQDLPVLRARLPTPGAASVSIDRRGDVLARAARPDLVVHPAMHLGGLAFERGVDEIAASVGIEVAEAVAFAELSEHPMPEAAFDDLYAEMRP